MRYLVKLVSSIIDNCITQQSGAKLLILAIKYHKHE